MPTRKPIGYRLEREVERSIRQYLNMRGILHAKTDAAQSFTHSGRTVSRVDVGWPDISGVLPGGRALFIECKTLTGRASESQLAMLENLRKAGALAFVARSAAEVHERFLSEHIDLSHAQRPKH